MWGQSMRLKNVSAKYGEAHCEHNQDQLNGVKLNLVLAQ